MRTISIRLNDKEDVLFRISRKTVNVVVIKWNSLCEQPGNMQREHLWE